MLARANKTKTISRANDLRGISSNLPLVKEKGPQQRFKHSRGKRGGAIMSWSGRKWGLHSTQWPTMVAACMTVHRVQGEVFKRVALWIPLRGL